MGEINCYNFVKILVKVFHVRAKQDSSKHILFILNSIRAHSVDENPVKTEDFFLHRNRFTQDGLYMFQPQRPTNGAAKKKKLSAASRSRNLFKLARIPQVLDTFFSKNFLKNLKIIELREFIASKFNV